MKIAGVPVVDATKKLKIKITPVDVKKGATKDPGACAAARSLLRQTGCTQARVHLGRTYVKVAEETTSGTIRERWVRYNTPEAIRAEIISFDRGGKFAPGEYTLSPVQPAARYGRGKQRGSTTSQTKPPGAKKKARAKPHMVSGVRAHGANR